MAIISASGSSFQYATCATLRGGFGTPGTTLGKLLLGSRNVPSLTRSTGWREWTSDRPSASPFTTRAIIAADEGLDHAPNFSPEGPGWREREPPGHQGGEQAGMAG